MLRKLSRFVNLPLPLPTRASHWNELQAGTPIAPSIVATCLGELPELIEEGIDEGIIRDVSGTVHLGGRISVWPQESI